MSWPRCQNCDTWVEATKCSNNTSDLRVFVHEDDLPATAKRFELDTQDDASRNCWTIDPAGGRICMPQGDGIYAYRGPFPWDDCTSCESASEEAGEGFPGGGGAGAGAGGGIGGGDGGGAWPWPNDPPKGIKATVCADHAPRAIARGWDVNNLYVPSDTERGQQGVFDNGGICINVPAGPVVNNPDPAFWIGLGNPQDDCTTCTHGVKQSLCPADQALPNAADAPEVWIRDADLPDTPDGFEYSGWCYEKQTAPSALIPDDARLLRPSNDQPCSTCNLGVPFALCPDAKDPGVAYWATKEAIDALLLDYPGLTTIVQRIDGVCHSLDLNAVASRIPTEAISIALRCQFESCLACTCGGQLNPVCPGLSGVPVRLCPGQNARNWRDTWVPNSRLPDKLTRFEHRGFCVWVDPFEASTLIPADAEILHRIGPAFVSCAECFGWNPPDPPGGGGGGGGPGGGENPPPPSKRWFRIWECGQGTTNKWVQLPRHTKIIAGKHDGKCYRVRHPGRLSLPVGGVAVVIVDAREKRAPNSTAACSLFRRDECGPIYFLAQCDDPGLIWGATRTDLAALVGKAVKHSGVWWKVFEGDPGGPINPVNVTEVMDDCPPDEPCIDCHTSAPCAAVNVSGNQAGHIPIQPGESYEDYKARKPDHRVCHRLLVWPCISHNGTGFTEVGGKVVVVTNSFGNNPCTNGPFRSGYDANQYAACDRPQGALLDDEPFWYDACGIGGWETGSTWFTPDLATLYGCVQSGLPAPGSSFTLIVHVRLSSYDKYADGSPYPESDGWADVLGVHVNCCE
jgi:hypothetical protein